jgi:anaerobic selenocysteine-containing dehydrogenase
MHAWPFILEAKKNGAKIVVIDPIRTRTAKQADWHVQIRPGTDGALALGMMNVIIAEDLVDHDYVDKYTLGYHEGASAFNDTGFADVDGHRSSPSDDENVRPLNARRFAKVDTRYNSLTSSFFMRPGCEGEPDLAKFANRAHRCSPS